jgi:hypothetical protein
MPRFDVVIAIAEDLGVSLDRLVGKEIVTEILDDQGVDVYPELINALKPMADFIAKPYRVHIRFEVISNAEEATVKNLHFMQYPKFGHMSDKHLMLRVICTGYLRIHDIYPRQGRGNIGTTEVENSYIVVNGSIYPENCKSINHEVMSVYDYVEHICRCDDDVTPYKKIRELFKIYGKERYALGIIGTLPPSAFYWFLYYLGRVTKF